MAAVSAERRRLQNDVRAVAARLRLLEQRLNALEQDAPRPRVSVAVVDEKECAGCGLCEENCPGRAITVHKTAQVDPARCLGCGICVSGCPRGAVSLRPREKPAGTRPRKTGRSSDE